VIVAVAKYVLSPSKVIAILLASGTVLLVSRRSVRTGKALVIAGVTLLFLFGSGVVTWWFMGRLEYRYPVLGSPDNLHPPEFIVVLAGHASYDKNISVSSQVNSNSAYRVLEAARLCRIFTNSSILITGFSNVPHVMRDLSVSIGIPGERIIVDDRSENTLESAKAVKRLVNNRNIVLVTSAGHMPRTIEIFRRNGMAPIPAPTDFMTYRNFKSIHLFPSPLHLHYSDLMVHEYLGTLWYRISDKT